MVDFHGCLADRYIAKGGNPSDLAATYTASQIHDGLADRHDPKQGIVVDVFRSTILPFVRRVHTSARASSMSFGRIWLAGMQTSSIRVERQNRCTPPDDYFLLMTLEAVVATNLHEKDRRASRPARVDFVNVQMSQMISRR